MVCLLSGINPRLYFSLNCLKPKQTFVSFLESRIQIYCGAKCADKKAADAVPGDVKVLTILLSC